MHEEEFVPPVPAIPKAYESPKDTHMEQPNFMGSKVRKASQQFETSSLSSGSAADFVPNTPSSKPSSNASRRTNVGSDVETSKSMTPNVAKKHLQPLRLPPLNLLPLSTPVASRITASYDTSSETDDGKTTPPPRRGNAKTPSTPMTASKATFFRMNSDEDPIPNTMHRSTSSNHVFHGEHGHRAPSSSSIQLVGSSRHGRETSSPFISNTLPKTSGDYNFLRKASGEYSSSTMDPPKSTSRLNGPRSQPMPPKLIKADSKEKGSERSLSPTPDTPSSTSSLRRKLSLSWKRSSSKASHAATERDAGYPPQPPKHNDMPPPRLPASATWSGALPGSAPSPSGSVKKSTDEPRALPPLLKSTSSLNNSHVRTVSDNNAQSKPTHSPKKESVSSIGKDSSHSHGHAHRAASSILSPVHKMLSSKNSLGSVKRQYDANVDPEDYPAEDEMRKLASKRKDFEAAAVEVDELRKRATPKERVSPNQAIRMVNLNVFERGEIVDYKDIYFCGTATAKKHVGDLSSTATNFGYDDDRGDYGIVNGDHLAYQYEIVDILGKGSFGQVVRCVDHKTGGLVAVKIIRNKKRFHQQALVEVNILKKLREWVSQDIYWYKGIC
jgi:dual specificity tyrosine-phosphorylation-regulated kinase 2/3/4